MAEAKRGRDYEIFVKIETNILFLHPPADRIEEIKRSSAKIMLNHEVNHQLHNIVEDLAATIVEEQIQKDRGE